MNTTAVIELGRSALPSFRKFISGFALAAKSAEGLLRAVREEDRAEREAKPRAPFTGRAGGW